MGVRKGCCLALWNRGGEAGESDSFLNVFSLIPEVPHATKFGASAMDQVASWFVPSVSQGFSFLRFVKSTITHVLACQLPEFCCYCLLS